MNAPGTETGGQNGDQGGAVEFFFAGNPKECGADKCVESHVQECGGISTNIEKAGTGQCGVAEDFQKAGDHCLPVGHEESSNEKETAEKQKKDFQKSVLRKGVQTFQSDTSISW